MPSRCQLTSEERSAIDAHYEHVKNFSEIARHINRNESTVRKYIRGKTFQPVQKKRGRHPGLSDRDKREIIRYASNEIMTAGHIKAQLGLKCGETAILNALNESPFIRRRKLKGIPKLNAKHKRSRIDWATERLNWDEEWKHCIFSDEKKFNLDGPDGYHYYWHDIRKEERHLMSRQQGGGGVMIWAAIGWTGRTKILLIETKLKASIYKLVLESGLLPSMSRIAESPIIFQQDNATPHIAGTTKEWFTRQGIEVMPWPSRSPDCNPMENCWAQVSRLVYADGKQYNHVDELTAAINDAWYKIPQSSIEALISSMRHRVQKVIELKGEYIGY